MAVFVPLDVGVTPRSLEKGAEPPTATLLGVRPSIQSFEDRTVGLTR